MKINNTLLKNALLLLVTIFLFSCKNDDDTPPLEQLPEATQTGRGIFGALVNGEPFVETGTFFNTFYQQIDGEFFFGIQGEFSDKNPLSIQLGTTALQIGEGVTLDLLENEIGNAWGGSRFLESGFNTEFANTNTTNSGILMITKLDFENNIVSGVFEMTVEDPFTGDRVEITDGRFDTLFTQ